MSTQDKKQAIDLKASFKDHAEGFWIEDVTRKNLPVLLPIIEGQARHHNVEFDSDAFTLKRAIFGNAPTSEAKLIMHSNYKQPVGFMLFNHMYTPKGYGFDMEDIHIADWFREAHGGGGSYGFGKLLQIARERHCDFIEWSLTRNNAGYAMDFYTKRCEAQVLEVTEYDLSHLLGKGGNQLNELPSAFSVEVIRSLEQVELAQASALKFGGLDPEIEKAMMVTINAPNNDSYICKNNMGEVVAVSFGNRCLSTITGENLYGVTTPVLFAQSEVEQQHAWMSMIEGVRKHADQRGDVDLLSWSANNGNAWELDMLGYMDAVPMMMEHGNPDSSFLRFRVEAKHIYGDLPERLVSSREFDPAQMSAAQRGNANVTSMNLAVR